MRSNVRLHRTDGSGPARVDHPDHTSRIRRPIDVVAIVPYAGLSGAIILLGMVGVTYLAVALPPTGGSVIALLMGVGITAVAPSLARRILASSVELLAR